MTTEAASVAAAYLALFFLLIKPKNELLETTTAETQSVESSGGKLEVRLHRSSNHDSLDARVEEIHIC